MKKFVFSLVFTIIAFNLISAPVYAQASNCALKTQYYGKCSVSNDNNTDLNLTTCGVTVGAFNGASLASGGDSPWNIGNCAMQLMDQIAQQNTGQTLMNCPPPPASVDCENKIIAVGIDKSFGEYAKTQESGSLLGLASVLHGVTLTEPIPVNLAYYWNDQIKNIPFVNKALAQDVTYSGPFLQPILDIWRTFRNLAYGILSVVMVVVGIMIINRKKISAQAVVNVQMALPRIVLALIFITFSYPIGATIASIAWSGGFSVADMIVYPTGGSQINLNAILELVQGFLLALIGPQMVTVAVGIACLIAVLVFAIIGEIKILIVYLKMIFSIIFAPITFALGAIPSADDNVFKWIKTMCIQGISIIAIRFMQQVTILFAVSVIISVIVTAANSPGTAIGQSFGSAILATFAIPVIMVYGYYLSTKMPTYVENWFGGGDNKKQRR